MERRNIALIGFRATGKSTAGEIVARKLGMRFIDMDLRLTAEAGRDIATRVEQEGWGPFRKAESRLLELLSLQEGLVVATGGGIILDLQNRRLLRRHFFTVWLKAASQTIQARSSTDPASPLTRPSLSELPLSEEIVKVLSEREPLYAQVADIEIDTEAKQVMAVAEEIVRAVKREESRTED